MATIKDLKEWMRRDICRFGRFDKVVQIVHESHEESVGLGKHRRVESRLRLKVFTDANEYAIMAVEDHDPENISRGYLGCLSSSRKPRAGEGWHRGNDLADGPLTELTWRRIMGDIISYELVDLAKPQVPKADIPESACVEATGPNKNKPQVGQGTRLITLDGTRLITLDEGGKTDKAVFAGAVGLEGEY